MFHHVPKKDGIRNERIRSTFNSNTIDHFTWNNITDISIKISNVIIILIHIYTLRKIPIRTYPIEKINLQYWLQHGQMINISYRYKSSLVNNISERKLADYSHRSLEYWIESHLQFLSWLDCTMLCSSPADYSTHCSIN